MAAIFLLLLYASPSALVLYWTANNLFSLIKTAILQTKNPRKICYAILWVSLTFLCVYIAFFRHHSRSYRLRNMILTFSVAGILAAIPLYLRFIVWTGKKCIPPYSGTEVSYRALFLSASAALALLMGLYIPITVMASSPFEFSFLGDTAHPFEILLFPLAQSIGLFFVWPTCLYLLFSQRIKRLLTVISVSTLVYAISFSMIAPSPAGSLTAALRFIEGGAFIVSSATEIRSVLIALLLLSLTAFLITKGKLSLLTKVSLLCAVSFMALGVYRGRILLSGYSDKKMILSRESDSQSTHGAIPKKISLSLDGHNVVLIMLDKAISSYLPLILEERPELQEIFEGFVYYPNTLSFGQKTIIGAPPLFGGYEYTPQAMNLRSNEPMVDKHNEALLVLPTLFMKNGYSTLITDAPFVNYQWIADGDFFRSRGIGATNLQGTLSSRYIHDYFGEITALGPDTLLKRNFIIFSLMSAAPHRLREALYNDGRYWNSTLLTLNTHTLDSYAVLHYLPDLTSFTASGNTFTSITNDLTHEPSLLSWPDYT
ncbi:MAG TPA: hypothetical protein PKH81_07485, partial [Treponemataceae bacterium]|nr:hypothetical protein [Treponemataceae bacterium]